MAQAQESKVGEEGGVSRNMSVHSQRAESKDDDEPTKQSAAASLTSIGPCSVKGLVFKFTTLSDGNEQSSFAVDRSGASVGRTSDNGIFVPSDATLVRYNHAAIEYQGERFFLSDRTTSDHHAAVRVGVGRAAREWPLVRGACFSAGNSVFEVESVDVGSGDPMMKLRAKTGPRKGSIIDVSREGCTMGRANDNTVCISPFKILLMLFGLFLAFYEYKKIC